MDLFDIRNIQAKTDYTTTTNVGGTSSKLAWNFCSYTSDPCSGQNTYASMTQEGECTPLAGSQIKAITQKILVDEDNDGNMVRSLQLNYGNGSTCKTNSEKTYSLTINLMCNPE